MISVVALALSGMAAFGQGGAAQNQARAARVSPDRETDIGLNIYQAMNSTTTANTSTQTPANAVGAMFELRHIHSPWIGYEMTFGYNSANATIAPAPAPACGINCTVPPQTLPSKGSLVGLDWVLSKKFGSLRPFFAGGFGFFIDEPAYSVTVGQKVTSTDKYPENDVVRPSYLYGGGVDWAFLAHWGVRLQYRGAFYKVPNLSTLYPAQGVYTQTREPMGGIFYSF